jgi:hypothetical protein
MSATPPSKVSVFKPVSMFGTHDPASFQSGKPTCPIGQVARQDAIKGLDLAGNWAYGNGLVGPWYCAPQSIMIRPA